MDSGYQLRQLAAVLLSNTLVLLFVSALLSWFYLLVLDGSLAYNHNRRIPIYILSALAIVSLCSLYFSLQRSRSMAGMMAKLKGVLEDAAVGVYPKEGLAFRKGDYFRDLAEPLNRCLNLLEQGQSGKDQEGPQRLASLILQLDDYHGDSRALKKELEQILQVMEG